MIKFEVVKDEFIKYSNNQVIMPTRATKFSVAYDFYSPIDAEILPNESVVIWTNIKALFPTNVGLILCVRSSMGVNGIILANAIGVVESDYYQNPSNDGNIGFRLLNLKDSKYIIKKNDKIGQGFFINFLTVTNEIAPTNQRKGGFGSTDKK